jgi:curved DNA-binding protein CbpA
MHKLYTTSPPHETELYDILHVSPNATAAQITKSYRNLSRKFHPDKQVATDQSALLKQVQDAYEILKDDSTRLPYHQYGLTDPNVAVAILLGPHHQNHYYSHLLDAAHHELLQLMGYEYFENNDQHHTSSTTISLDDAKRRRRQRAQFVAARLVERLRPLVEESVSPSLVAHQLARECDQWKRLPLGAQVIRCVGRAYRHAGQDYLQQQLRYHQKQPKVLDYYSVPVRQQWRKAKAFWTAILATGRVTVTEQVWVQQEKRRKRLKEKENKSSATPKIDYHSQNLGNIDSSGGSESDEEDTMDTIFSSDEGDNDDDDDDEEERKHIERFRAKQTVLTSLQVEALWKVAKIDLDRVIRRACRLILTQKYFFFPSHQSLDSHGEPASHGWVTSRGRMMDADEALQKTAEALVFLGNVMVERSKVETSWKE